MSFAYSRPITIDHTKVGASDLTNFPVGIIGTYSWLTTVANGGRVQNANGYDIRPYADAAGTQPLNFELVSYNGSTGAIEMWVSIPTLSHTADTVIYLFYDDATISTNGSSASTWDTGFAAVYHLGDDPFSTAPEFKDSTSAGRHLTKSEAINTFGTSSATIATISGPVGRGVQLTPVSQYYGYALRSTAASGLGSGSMSIQGWLRIDNYGLSMDAPWLGVFGREQPTYPGNTFVVALDYSDATHVFRANVGADSYSSTNTSSLAAAVSTWVHVALTYDGTFTRMYCNGALQFSETMPEPPGTDGPTWIGAAPVGDRALPISLDEFRYSSTARSADWIGAEYNNQSSPATFYAMGSETPLLGTWQQGFDFRYTSASVTLPANECFVLGLPSTLGVPYPTSSLGTSFGWTTNSSSVITRDRQVDPFPAELDGLNGASDGTVDPTFRVDLYRPGTYEVRLALGDFNNSQQRNSITIYDNTTSLYTLDAGATAGSHFKDATGADRYYNNTGGGGGIGWVETNQPVTLTFSTTVFNIKLRGDGGANATYIAHLGLKLISTGSSASTGNPFVYGANTTHMTLIRSGTRNRVIMHP